jgi:hypothetical protein
MSPTQRLNACEFGRAVPSGIWLGGGGGGGFEFKNFDLLPLEGPLKKNLTRSAIPTFRGLLWAVGPSFLTFL